MMRPGLAAWGLRLTPLREQLAMTKRLGVDILELGINGFIHDLLQADSPDCAVVTVKDLFRKAELTPIAAATGNDFTCDDEKDSLATLANTLSALKIADKLGIKYLRIFAGFAPVESVTGKRYALLTDCLKQVYEAAASTQVLPVVETHGGVELLPDGSVKHIPSISTEYETLDRLLDEIPSMRLNFDPANLFVLGKNVTDFYDRYKEKIAYVHLKEFVRAGQGWRPAACGTGQMPWNDLLGAMRSFTGPALLEYEIPSDVEEGFRHSLDFLKEKEKELED